MTGPAVTWTKDVSSQYVRYMERNVPHDHRRWAERIAADWPAVPGSVVLDVAGGPAFLALELGRHLDRPQLLVADYSHEMLRLGVQRAAAREERIEPVACCAERLALRDASVDLVICKHFVRLAPDLDGTLREMARVLRPGGRAYLVDFEREAPRHWAFLLKTWIRFTAPPVVRDAFDSSFASGLRAPEVAAKLTAAGFSDARVLHRGVSYLVRGDR